jgi:uncharacterized membrane protein (DUF441 family)
VLTISLIFGGLAAVALFGGDTSVAYIAAAIALLAGSAA